MKSLGSLYLQGKDTSNLQGSGKKRCLRFYHSHPLLTAIFIVVLGVIAGCKHFTQQAILKNDKTIRKLFDWDKFISLSIFGGFSGSSILNIVLNLAMRKQLCAK